MSHLNRWLFENVLYLLLGGDLISTMRNLHTDVKGRLLGWFVSVSGWEPDLHQGKHVENG